MTSWIITFANILPCRIDGNDKVQIFHYMEGSWF